MDRRTFAFGAGSVLAASIPSGAIAQSTPAEIVVRSGESRTIPPRLYQPSRLVVEEGGVLTIQPGANRWAVFWVSGDVTILGSIVAEQFSLGSSTVRDVTPDGVRIEHTFERAALGGMGGNGGVSSQLGAGTRSGGQGALGTNRYGGGGGSGGGIYIAGPSTRLGGPGRDAQGYQGAPLADMSNDNHGGNGGLTSTSAFGGLICIFAGGACEALGKISIRGSAGAPGARGGAGFNSNRGLRGGGGGGGGGPGGDGGRAILIGNGFETCEIDAAGGLGGSGGSTTGFSNGATAGTDGEPGAAGLIDFYRRDQWPPNT